MLFTMGMALLSLRVGRRGLESNENDWIRRSNIAKQSLFSMIFLCNLNILGNVRHRKGRFLSLTSVPALSSPSYFIWKIPDKSITLEELQQLGNVRKSLNFKEKSHNSASMNVKCAVLIRIEIRNTCFGSGLSNYL